MSALYRIHRYDIWAIIECFDAKWVAQHVQDAIPLGGRGHIEISVNPPGNYRRIASFDPTDGLIGEFIWR